MPKKCCVPNCKGNYTCAERVSVFKFPKDEVLRKLWMDKIPRKDFIPNDNTVVCANHFIDDFVVRVDSVTRPDGSVLTVKRDIPKLTKEAYPSIFPNCPSYLSETPAAARKAPDERRQEEELFPRGFRQRKMAKTFYFGKRKRHSKPRGRHAKAAKKDSDDMTVTDRPVNGTGVEPVDVEARSQMLGMLSLWSTGDFVKISDDVNQVQALQDSHGGWNDEMKNDLGKVGVVKSVDRDGDVLVKIKGHSWTWNPQCCTKVSEGPDGESSSDSNDEFSLVAFLAAKRGQVEIVQDLLKKNPDWIDNKLFGKTALTEASYRGHTDVVEVLLEAGASVNTKDKEKLTALQCAAIGNRPEVVKLLIQKEAEIDSVDKSGNTAFHNAILHGATKVYGLLINHPKVDISFKNEKGFDVLHFAALKGDAVATNLILTKHPELVNTKIKEEGFTALHIAALNGHDHVAKHLIKKGAQLNIRTNQQLTPLHLAVAKSHLSMAEILVTNGANVDVKEKEGNTPLHLAVMINTGLTSGHCTTVRNLVPDQLGIKDKEMGFTIACFLVKKGADINIINDYGLTAIDEITDPVKKETLRMFAASS